MVSVMNTKSDREKSSPEGLAEAERAFEAAISAGARFTKEGYAEAKAAMETLADELRRRRERERATAKALITIANDLEQLADALAEFDGDEADLEGMLNKAEILAARARDAAFGAEPIPLDAIKAIEAGESPIAAIRKSRGMTQVELAAASGYSEIYISKLERGEKEVKPETADALAFALRVLPENVYDK